MLSPEKGKKKSGKQIAICIGGMAGSGKSTVARKLAKKYRLDYISGGDALKALAVEEGYKFVGPGWWESREGMRFLAERDKDNRFDEAVDRKLLQMARKGNVMLDSWTMPWLLEGAFKIWLEASPEKRAERIAGRDRIGFEEALKALKRKEKQTKKIYKKLYGFKLGEDFAPFNFILDTNDLNSEEVFLIICMVMDNVLFKS
ncbi:MAG TPA: cytidylate kinase family protein [candidate division Zixibacteria bacterium]|nr:cytidylate kinase family protein [candidate division Zixibacteria bacterium]